MRMLDVIEDINPPKPPCHSHQSTWIGYLQSAFEAGAQNLIKDGQLNPNFNFCQDCPKDFSEQKQKEGKCDRNFLKKGKS